MRDSQFLAGLPQVLQEGLGCSSFPMIPTKPVPGLPPLVIRVELRPGETAHSGFQPDLTQATKALGGTLNTLSLEPQDLMTQNLHKAVPGIYILTL